MLALPIDPLIPKILSSLESRPNLVLQASPGSGKTTRVPPALLRASFGPAASEILVLEPRRLAAKWAAKRVADEMGSRLGDEVGYQFRFENVTSPRTRLKFLTEGMLMRRLLGDPTLKNVSAVILDEFHERHLHGDLALAYLHWIQAKSRPDLRILVMSATLETETLSSYLGGAPVLNIEAKLHPVTIEHLKAPPAKHLDLTVKDAVVQALQAPTPAQDKGHILVFLPGMGEIRRCADTLRPLAESRNLLIAPLHGELSRDEQDQALTPTQKRKIILATNVAETSLTIEGVTTVIDSGFHRVANYSWWSGIPSLRTRPISQASAIQRCGRAGRTAPGICYRLYTKEDFNTRPAFQTPEIRRADLTQTVLELKTLGVQDMKEFPWFEAPDKTLIESAENLLLRLGALEAGARALSAIGKRISEIPAHPRLGRMLLEAERSGCLDDAATLAAMISEGELDSLDALAGIETFHRLPRPVQDRLARMRDQLKSSFARKTAHIKDASHAKLGFALLCGFPDRVAKRRGDELLLASGGSARLPESTVLGSAELLVAIDLQETQNLGQQRSRLQARAVSPIEPEWLFDLIPSALEEKEELKWEPNQKRITAVSQLVYDSLVISESPLKNPNPEAKGRFLAKMALGLDLGAPISIGDLIHRIGSSSAGQQAAEDLEDTIVRLQILNATPVTPEVLARFLAQALGEKSSLDDVKDIAWASALTTYLEAESPGITSQLEQSVPTHFQFPNGKRARIQYKLDKTPWIESPLQNFFGVKQPPAIARGRVPLTLHLLAPNQRAVQVTTDLPGFWQRTYPEVRKELSRRYPRHTWPEDPTTQPPVKR